MLKFYGIALLLFSVFFPVIASSQTTTIVGRVVDQISAEPLEYATITLLNKKDQSLITGGITDENGRFAIETTATAFTVKIAFLGYVTENLNNTQIENNTIDLQEIRIRPNVSVLEKIEVVAEKSQTVFHLDKRVFNVGKDLSSAGGSALDVLNNVPSVDVNIDGAVSLRGNANVQILINGKLSVMTSGNSNTLGTISAEMIDRVEVITNPSAKYEAEGTSGIINIVIKKDKRKGLNGSLTLNTGIPNNHSIGLSVNRRTEKFNLFSQLGIGRRTFLSNHRGSTIDRSRTDLLSLNNAGKAEKHEQFYHIRLGADYHLNPHNVITLSGQFGFEFEDEFSTTNYDLLAGKRAIASVLLPARRYGRHQSKMGV